MYMYCASATCVRPATATTVSRAESIHFTMISNLRGKKPARPPMPYHLLLTPIGASSQLVLALNPGAPRFVDFPPRCRILPNRPPRRPGLPPAGKGNPRRGTAVGVGGSAGRPVPIGLGG